MNYRITKLLDESSLNATTGTEMIPIRVQDPISRIDIRHKVTKGEATANSAHIASSITKIELVDGSDVLHSLTGYENQALAIYSRRVQTMIHGQCLHNNSLEGEYGIDFGRHLWDEELALDPKQFGNLQLKVSYSNRSASPAGSSPVLEVFARCFDEKIISPIGFLTAKELIDKTAPANNAYFSDELPVDYAIRQMLVRGYRAGAYEPWGSVKEVRLSEDNLKRIVFDLNMENYHRIMKGVNLMVEEFIYGYSAGTTGVVFYVTPTDYFAHIIANGVDNVAVYNPRASGGYATIKGAGAVYFLGVVRGYLPHHTFQFPFGKQDAIEDWYDVANVGSLKSRVRGGSNGANATYQITLEQLRRY